MLPAARVSSTLTLPVYCQRCGNRLTDEYVSFSHPYWPPPLRLALCPACAAGATRCRACALPLAEADGGDGLCSTCRTALPRCATCNSTLTGDWIHVGERGPYCLDCYRQRPPCDVCGAPLDDDHRALADGRRICRLCSATAVDTPEEAQTLYRYVEHVIATRLGLHLAQRPPVMLVDRTALAGLIGRLAPAPLDATRTFGLHASDGDWQAIYLQSGLPRLLFVQVLAHEWTHGWQRAHCPPDQPLLVREGLAEWVAYRTLASLGAEANLATMRARSDLYGRGLRRALEIEAGGGQAAVLAWGQGRHFGASTPGLKDA